MPHRVWKLLAGLIGLVVVAGCAGNTTGAGSNTAIAADVALGVHLPLTGAASFVGQGFQLGSQLAFNEINQHGGVNGHKLKVIYEDDAGTPDGGVTTVRRLIDQSKVFAVVGGSTSTATVAVLPSMMTGPTPYFVSLASDPRVLATYSDYVFSGATVPQKDIVASMVKFITTSLKPKSVALMQCDQGHCQSGVPLLKSGLESAGVTVPTVQQYHSGDTDFTAQIDAIKKTNAEVVGIYGLAADGGRIIPQVRRAGINAKLVADTSLADPSVLRVAGASSDGFYAMWLGATQFVDDKTGVMGDWRERFDKANPNAPSGTPNLYSLMGYADAYVVAEGIRRASSNLTQKNFIDQLNTLDGFVAGKDPYFKYAAPIGLPRSFKKGDHQGNRSVTPIVAKGGSFKVAT
jgi:branched-chain amino acid transport system substrate-binding protein